MSAFTLDCKDPNELAKLYAALLKWEVPFYDEEYAVMDTPGTNQGAYPGITFQRNPEYQPPVWPEEPEAQQQMAHIDFAVNDLEKSVGYAIHCGATVTEKQFSDGWTMMFNPTRYPFYLCQMKHVFESSHFALLQEAAKRDGMSMARIRLGAYIRLTSYQTESEHNSRLGSFLFSFARTSNLQIKSSSKIPNVN